MKWLLLLLPLLIHAELIKQKYGTCSSSITQPVHRIQLFGERCSGTNFFEALLKKNYPYIDRQFFQYGFKHFPCWFNYPFEEKYLAPRSSHSLENSDDCLFLLIFRNPYDWIRSLCRKPHNATENLMGNTLDQFIRTKWTVPKDDVNYQIEMNPQTGQPFENVLKLRTARIANLLLIPNKVKNFYFINYETLKKNPREVLQEIARLYGIEMKEQFEPVLEYMVGGTMRNKKYEGSYYRPISSEDLKFINQQLDWAVEERIGYSKRSAVDR